MSEAFAIPPEVHWTGAPALIARLTDEGLEPFVDDDGAATLTYRTLEEWADASVPLDIMTAPTSAWIFLRRQPALDEGAVRSAFEVLVEGLVEYPLEDQIDEDVAAEVWWERYPLPGKRTSGDDLVDELVKVAGPAIERWVSRLTGCFWETVRIELDQDFWNGWFQRAEEAAAQEVDP